MDYTKREVSEYGSARIVNCLPEIGIDTVVEEIVEGLSCRPKRLSSKYFYDKEGSVLFERITALEEYYPSRTEKAILRGLPLCSLTDCAELDIIELGSGDHSKITLLLEKIPNDRLSGMRYVAVDISRPALDASIRELTCLFPGLQISGIVGDYFHQMHLVTGARQKLYCFLGSTIGNLDRDDAMVFVRNLGETMSSGDSFLIGFDRIKDTEILERAYNDDGGVTARFNKNILNVVNRLIDADFDPDDFEHRAFYNQEERRIEMHLMAIEDMRVKTPYVKDDLFLRKGEMIHTENSHKFDEVDIAQIADRAGLSVDRIISDENMWFSLVQYMKG